METELENVRRKIATLDAKISATNTVDISELQQQLLLEDKKILVGLMKKEERLSSNFFSPPLQFLPHSI